MERLFVYGTLGPGRPNEHVLDSVEGTWSRATVRGFLRQKGWGAELGYPAIELHEKGDEVRGFLFTSEHLSDLWPALDAFEGEAYARVITRVKGEDGEWVEANVYALKSATKS